MHLINTCREQHLRKYISISYLNIKEEMLYAPSILISNIPNEKYLRDEEFHSYDDNYEVLSIFFIRSNECGAVDNFVDSRSFIV